MYNNYHIDYILRNNINHPLTACKFKAININTTNNNLVINQKFIYNILSNIILIFGQYPLLKKAKNSVSAFNIRLNSTIGTLINLKKQEIPNFLKKFIFSILPNLKTWQNLKTQKYFNKFFILNIGFKDLSFWYDIKNLNYTGVHIQIIINQNSLNVDYLFFLSKFNIRIK